MPGENKNARYKDFSVRYNNVINDKHLLDIKMHKSFCEKIYFISVKYGRSKYDFFEMCEGLKIKSSKLASGTRGWK